MKIFIDELICGSYGSGFTFESTQGDELISVLGLAALEAFTTDNHCIIIFRHTLISLGVNIVDGSDSSLDTEVALFITFRLILTADWHSCDFI